LKVETIVFHELTVITSSGQLTGHLMGSENHLWQQSMLHCVNERVTPKFR